MKITDFGPCDRATWYKLYRIYREHTTSPLGDSFADKVYLLNCIRQNEKDGVVRVCDRFMDCDCAVSTSSRLVSANYYAVQRCMDEIYDWAEGPGSCWVTSPDDTPERAARDLVMEAFEDGHPHVVYY